MENSEKNLAEEVAANFKGVSGLPPTGLVVNTSVPGLRIIDEQINLVRGKPASEYYFLSEITRYANDSNYVGTVYDISYIYGSELHHAKILLRKNIAEMIESTSGFRLASTDTGASNVLYIISNIAEDFAFLLNKYNTRLDIRIHGESMFKNSTIIE